MTSTVPASVALFSAEEHVPLAFVHCIYTYKKGSDELISEQIVVNPETGVLRGRIDFKYFVDDIEISKLNELRFERRLKNHKKIKSLSQSSLQTVELISRRFKKTNT